MRFQSVAALLSFAGFLLALAIGLAAAFGTRLGFWDLEEGLKLLVPGVVVGTIAVVSGIAWLITALARNSSAGTRLGAVGLIGAAAVIAFPINAARIAYDAPPLHDISTDIEHAPEFVALLPYRKDATNSPNYDGRALVFYDGKRMPAWIAQRKAYADIRPIAILGMTPAKMFWRAFEAAKRMGWNIVVFDADKGRIEASDTSLWFGRVSDIVIRVRPAGKLGARLDIRAESRNGEIDRGRNAALIRAYYRKLASR